MNVGSAERTFLHSGRARCTHAHVKTRTWSVRFLTLSADAAQPVFGHVRRDSLRRPFGSEKGTVGTSSVGMEHGCVTRLRSKPLVFVHVSSIENVFFSYQSRKHQVAHTDSRWPRKSCRHNFDRLKTVTKKKILTVFMFKVFFF